MNISKSEKTMALVPVVLDMYKHAAINNLPCPTLEDIIRNTSRTEHEVNSANMHLIRGGSILVEKIAARRRIYVKSIGLFTEWTAIKYHEETRKHRKCLVCSYQFMSYSRYNRVCNKCKSHEGHGLWGMQWE